MVKNVIFYFTIRGGSLKKMAKNIIPKVPTNKKVYTNASIEYKILDIFFLKNDVILFVSFSVSFSKFSTWNRF